MNFYILINRFDLRKSFIKLRFCQVSKNLAAPPYWPSEKKSCSDLMDFLSRDLVAH